jgi:hypothetical protein
MIKCLLCRVGHENCGQVKDGWRFRVVPVDRFHRLGHLRAEPYLRLCWKMAVATLSNRRVIGFIISLHGGVPSESSSPRTAILGPWELHDKMLLWEENCEQEENDEKASCK